MMVQAQDELAGKDEKIEEVSRAGLLMGAGGSVSPDFAEEVDSAVKALIGNSSSSALDFLCLGKWGVASLLARRRRAGMS